MLEGNGEIKKKEWKEFTRFSLVIKILTDILYFPIAVGLCGFFFLLKIEVLASLAYLYFPSLSFRWRSRTYASSFPRHCL